MRPAVRWLGLAGLLGGAVASELRLSRPVQPSTDAWQTLPIEPRRQTRLGFSYRTPQIEAFGLDGPTTLATLLAYPFQIVRLGAYWKRVEPAPGFDPSELDLQLDMAERAGKQVILAVGAVKAFGYPEFFAPPHVVASLPERQRIQAANNPALLAAATRFVERIVERYRASATASRGRSNTRRSTRSAWSTPGDWTRTSSRRRCRPCIGPTPRARS